MAKYKVLRSFGHATLGTVKLGAVVELDDADAKPLAKIGAIGLHFEDDEPTPQEKPVTQKRRAPPKRRRKQSDEEV